MSRDYYDIGGISVYDFIKAKELGFEEANIIKYVSRYKLKDGVSDLEKAKWYLERLIEHHTSPTIRPPITMATTAISSWDEEYDGKYSK